MRNRALAVLLAVLLSLAASCSKDGFSVDMLQAQPYVRQGGHMGLSLYVITDAKSPEAMQMVVRDPSGNLSWSFTVNEVSYEGQVYYGSSDITMPAGSALPTGTWSVDMYFRDGSTLNESFDVSYSDCEGAIERAQDVDEAWFDADSNLTVIP
ncbi:MAG: hypothetical protein IJ863_08450 [Spirochaetales bacterium]|nr:hypothetical protein [Spirochaetales bacterium]